MLRCGGVAVAFPDDVLTHVEIVVMQQMLRRSGVQVSWVWSVDAGSGRGSLWVTPSAGVRFDFDRPRVPVIDPEWLAALRQAALGASGLVVVDRDGRPVPGTIPRGRR